MADVHAQIDKLAEHINEGAEATKQYLGGLKKNVSDYDAQHKSSTASSTAASVLESGLGTAEASVNELQHIAAQLHAQSKNASDETIQTAQQALCKVKHSLESLLKAAQEYDEKFAGGSGGQAASGLQEVVNKAQQSATSAIDMAEEQGASLLEKMQNAAGGVKHTAQVATGEAVKVAGKVDETLGVSPKLGAVVGKVKALDERMHVTETAKKVDAKLTGGLATRVAEKGMAMASEAVEYIADTLEQARIAADASPTMRHVEVMGETASAEAGKAGQAVSDTATSAKDSVMGMAGQAKDSAMGMAGQVKDTAMGMMPSSSSGGGSMTEQAEQATGSAMEKGEQMKEGVKNTLGSAKDKGQEMTEGSKQGASGMAQQAKDTASSAVDSAKQKGSEAVGKAKDTASSATDKAKDTASSAKDTVKDTASSAAGKAKDTASSATDTAKDTASSAAGKAKEMTGQGGSSSSGSGSSSGSSSSSQPGVMEHAKQAFTAAKEAATGQSTSKSATDVRHEQHEQPGEQASVMQQAAATASHAAEQGKERMADVMSRQKNIAKAATKP